MTLDLREWISLPFPEAELTINATPCATQQVKLIGKTHPVNATHELLLEYARTRATTAPSGTIRQFTAWWESVTGYRIPERTFQRHTRVLRDLGLVDVRYGHDELLVKRTWYNLAGIRIEAPWGVLDSDDRCPPWIRVDAIPAGYDGPLPF